MASEKHDHDAYTLRRIYRRLWRSEPNAIWEVGSRDATDGRVLAEVFTSARVTCFEPNPDTWPLVEACAAAHPRMDALQCALSDADGEITFFKIDTSKTRTTWRDGNPGASSLFEASGAYDVEDYVQTPVPVLAMRAESLIDKQGMDVPDLVWMDVQGAELLALSGFGRHLGDVRMVAVELSLHPIYQGQALAPDVVQMLSRAGFRWYSVLHPGEWQFDAVFVRKHGSPVVSIRDRFLTRSLASTRQLGVRVGASEVARHRTTDRARRGLERGSRRAADVMTRHDSPRLAAAARSSLRVFRVAESHPIPLPARILLESSQQIDPLSKAPDELELPNIDIVVPCSPEDAPLIPWCIEFARQCSDNPVRSVIVIGAGRSGGSLTTALEGTIADFVPEGDIIPTEIMNAVRSVVPQDRQGWVLQQVAKLAAVAASSAEGVLVLDADTLLLKSRTWLRGGVQLLLPSHEFHIPYAKHCAASLGVPLRRQELSFVTHHQLMQPRVVRDMFAPAGEDVAAGLTRWVRFGDYTNPSAVSEFHSYGSWLATNRLNGFAFGRWGNTEVPRAELLDRLEGRSREAARGELQALYPTALSLSAHWHL